MARSLDREEAAPPFHRTFGQCLAHCPETAALLAVVAVALLLRVTGITWGLPNAERMGSYHPDEAVNLVNGVLVAGVLRPHLDIGFYNYGSLFFLLWQAAAAVNSAYGLVRVPMAASLNSPATDTVAALILVGRLLSVLSGTMTCVLLWWAGRQLRNAWAGIGAAVLYAAAPLAVVHGHFATVDVTATLLISAVQVSALGIVARARRTLVLCSGLLAGFAAATRYNAVLALVMPVVAIWLSRDQSVTNRVRRLTLTGYAAGACALGFLLGCPGMLMNWPRFSRDFLFELEKSRAGMGLLFEGTGPGWVYHYVVSLRHGLGVPLLAVVSLAVVYALARPRRHGLVLLAFVTVYYFTMGTAQVRFTRYMLPLLPSLFLLVGLLATEQNGTTLVRIGRRLVLAVAAISVLHAGAAYAVHMTAPDPRDEAAEYLRTGLPRRCRIAFATVPWYWSPPLLPEFTAPLPGQIRREMILRADPEKSLLLPGPDREWDPVVFATDDPVAVVISDIESQDALRLGRAKARQFIRRAAESRRIVTFGSRPALFGIRAAAEGYLPNDMLYVCPRITVYVPLKH